MYFVNYKPDNILRMSGYCLSGYVDDAVASHYEECSKLDPQTQNNEL